MKLRSFALAGIALAAMTSSASAATGWYIGLGAGFAGIDPVRVSHASPSFSTTVKHDASAAFAGAAGYKFDGIVRLENEIAYSSHDVKTGTGSTEVMTNMINMVADVPVYGDWSLSVGAGLGIGRVDVNLPQGALTLATGTKTGLAWQGIVGLTIPVSPQISLFGEYRYRNVELNERFATSFTAYSPMIVKGTHEQNLMFGLRYFVE